MSDEDYEGEIYLYAVYQWDCECGEVNEVGHDAASEILECASCQGRYKVAETR